MRFTGQVIVYSEIERIGNLIISACHKCEYREFKLVLEDRLVNGMVAFLLSLKRYKLSPDTLRLYQQYKERLKECNQEYKNLSHIVRHNKFAQRWKNHQ